MGEIEYGEHVCKPLNQWVGTLIKMLEAKPTVRSVERVEYDILKIKRKNNYSDIMLYIVDAYVLGEGATLEIITNNPEINCIVVPSNWNEYSGRAKMLAMENKVALFTLSELMGAVFYNGKRFIEYELPKKDNKNF